MARDRQNPITHKGKGGVEMRITITLEERGELPIIKVINVKDLPDCYDGHIPSTIALAWEDIKTQYYEDRKIK